MKKIITLFSAAFMLLAATTSCEILEGGGSKDAVDLGLSVKWATCNLGATSPEQPGGFYSWGETTPKTSNFGSMEGYKYVKTKKSSYGDNILIYDKYYPDTDKTKLDPEDDAARVKLGGKWRMPTIAEFQELIDNCTWTLTTRGGVDGFEVKSKVNDNSIFLPFTGMYGPSGGTINPDGATLSHKDHGFTWTSDMGGSLSGYQLWSGYYKKGKPGGWWGIQRELGVPIRPVCD